MVPQLVSVAESGLVDGDRINGGCLGVFPGLLPKEGATTDVGTKVQLEIKVGWVSIRLVRAGDQVLHIVCITSVFKVRRYKHSPTPTAISPS